MHLGSADSLTYQKLIFRGAVAVVDKQSNPNQSEIQIDTSDIPCDENKIVFIIGA